MLIIFMWGFDCSGFFSQQLWCPACVDVVGEASEFQISAEQGAAPAQTGKFWQGVTHVSRNTATVFKTFYSL